MYLSSPSDEIFWSEFLVLYNRESMGEKEYCTILYDAEWNWIWIGKVEIYICMSMQMVCGEFYKQIQTNKRKTDAVTTSLKYLFGE